jgi:hypothetical protein
MVPGNRPVHENSAAAARLHAESAEWLRELADRGPRREAALARLHGLLVRIARGEVARREPRLAHDLGVNYTPKLVNIAIGDPAAVQTMTLTNPSPAQNPPAGRRGWHVLGLPAAVRGGSQPRASRPHP